MKKQFIKIIALACMSICSQSFAQQKTNIEIVPGLKNQDHGDGIPVKGGPGSVVRSTVEVSSSGEETIVYDKLDVQAGKKVAPPKVVVNSPPVPVKSNLQAASNKGVEVVDTANANDPFAETPPSKAIPAATKSPIRPVQSKGAIDRSVPEVGVKVNERVTTERVIEKMVPPSDELIYGALKAQGLADKQPAAKGATGATDRPIVIDAIQGVNEIITIGKGDLNRFVTPFSKVIVRTSAGEDELVSKVDGNVVYIGAVRRAGVFLVEAGSGRAFSLTLVPDDVPPRDIYLTMGRSANIPASLQMQNSAKDDEFTKNSGKASSHVDNIKQGMRSIAQGKLPSGYTLLRPRLTDFRCSLPSLRVRLGQVLEGSGRKYLVYRVDNETPNEITIDEQYCYRRGVIAISAWPDVVVPAGGSTELFVLMDMAAEDVEIGGRPSLIGQEEK